MEILNKKKLFFYSLPKSHEDLSSSIFKLPSFNFPLPISFFPLKKYPLILLLSLFPFFCQAQTIKIRNGGINGGLAFNFGTTINRIGVYFGGFYYYDFIQLNSSFRVYYNFKTFGPSIKGFEWQPSLGMVGSFGKRQSELDPFYDVLGNQTGRKFSLGYAYNFYFDPMKTSQRTGTILVGVGRFELITENDILATRRSDRFRTGGIKLSYVYENMLFAINAITWTGNPQSPSTKRINDSGFPSRFGYLDISDAPYGKYSHGILALQYKYALGYGQDIQFSLGGDSEKVRNFIQNKLVHDMYFWPRKWNKARNPHLPMLDSEGMPYIYKEGQRIKAPSLYFDLSLNPGNFY